MPSRLADSFGNPRLDGMLAWPAATYFCLTDDFRLTRFRRGDRALERCDGQGRNSHQRQLQLWVATRGSKAELAADTHGSAALRKRMVWVGYCVFDEPRESCTERERSQVTPLWT